MSCVNPDQRSQIREAFELWARNKKEAITGQDARDAFQTTLDKRYTLFKSSFRHDFKLDVSQTIVADCPSVAKALQDMQDEDIANLDDVKVEHRLQKAKDRKELVDILLAMFTTRALQNLMQDMSHIERCMDTPRIQAEQSSSLRKLRAQRVVEPDSLSDILYVRKEAFPVLVSDFWEEQAEYIMACMQKVSYERVSKLILNYQQKSTPKQPEKLISLDGPEFKFVFDSHDFSDEGDSPEKKAQSPLKQALMKAEGIAADKPVPEHNPYLGLEALFQEAEPESQTPSDRQEAKAVIQFLNYQNLGSALLQLQLERYIMIRQSTPAAWHAGDAVSELQVKHALDEFKHRLRVGAVLEPLVSWGGVGICLLIPRGEEETIPNIDPSLVHEICMRLAKHIPALKQVGLALTRNIWQAHNAYEQFNCRISEGKWGIYGAPSEYDLRRMEMLSLISVPDTPNARRLEKLLEADDRPSTLRGPSLLEEKDRLMPLRNTHNLRTSGEGSSRNLAMRRRAFTLDI